MAHVFELLGLVFQLAMLAVVLGVVGYGFNRLIANHLDSRSSLVKMSNVELARARAHTRHAQRVRGQALS